MTPDGAVHVGLYDEDEFNGPGLMSLPNGSVFRGTWSKGVKEGFGSLSFGNGRVLQGEWVQGECHDGEISGGKELPVCGLIEGTLVPND